MNNGNQKSNKKSWTPTKKSWPNIQKNLVTTNISKKPHEHNHKASILEGQT
jgi:hypothetical protein